MTELTGTVRFSGKGPCFKKTAAMMLTACREFYQNPENEKAFQEWKTTKGRRDNGEKDILRTVEHHQHADRITDLAEYQRQTRDAV